MKKTDKQRKENCKKNKTWELFYPDGTSSLMNYNPIEEKKKQIVAYLKKEGKIWKSAYKNKTLHKFINKINLDLKLNLEGIQ